MMIDVFVCSFEDPSIRATCSDDMQLISFVIIPLA